MRRKQSNNVKLLSRYRYIYCLIESRKKCYLQCSGVGGAGISMVHFKDLAAVVSEATNEKYEILDEGVSHEKVVETIQKNYCVLPMGFGQITTEQDIKGFLNKNYSHLKRLFSELEGKTELSLKVMLKMDNLLQDITASDRKINHLQQKIASESEDAAYYDKIEMGKLVEDQVKKTGDRITSDIIRELQTHSEKYCKNQNLTEEMILNGVFLVKKENEPAFDRAVDAIEEKYGDRVEIRYVTSPPYDFADLRIRR